MRGRVTVCGLGPGRADGLTGATLAAIESAGARFVRTSQHPTAQLVPNATSFDHLYQQADSFDQVYRAIVEALVEAAAAASLDGRPSAGVLYAVPGSPLVLEDSVRRLRADGRVDVTVLPAVSFLDEVWARLAVDPVDESVRLIDGHQFAVQAAGERGPLLVAHVHAPWVLSQIKLALDAGDEQRVVVLQRLGTPDERVVEVGWPDLDRLIDPDHLTSLYLPEVTAPVARELVRCVELMARLRRECPWDRGQSHQSLRQYLLEETYEVLDAIDALAPSGCSAGGWDEPFGVDLSISDGYEALEEELGDLWFQILFHSELATEAGQFSILDVARTLHDKLVRRHPHVFGDVTVADSSEVVANWEQIKKAEKERDSALDGIPNSLPALSLAAKVLQRAERAGAPADLGSIGAQVGQLVPDNGDQRELGRYLLGLVELARRRNLDPEAALRAATMAAGERFRAGEQSGSPARNWALG